MSSRIKDISKFKVCSFIQGKKYTIKTIGAQLITYKGITYMGRKGIHHVFKMFCPNGDSWLFTQTDVQLMNKEIKEC